MLSQPVVEIRPTVSRSAAGKSNPSRSGPSVSQRQQQKRRASPIASPPPDKRSRLVEGVESNEDGEEEVSVPPVTRSQAKGGRAKKAARSSKPALKKAPVGEDLEGNPLNPDLFPMPLRFSDPEPARFTSAQVIELIQKLVPVSVLAYLVFLELLSCPLIIAFKSMCLVHRA